MWKKYELANEIARFGGLIFFFNVFEWIKC
jgi:hypothetical protein